MNGYTVEHDSEVQICICQMSFIELKEFIALIDMYRNLGYIYVKESDERNGIIISRISS